MLRTAQGDPKADIRAHEWGHNSLCPHAQTTSMHFAKDLCQGLRVNKVFGPGVELSRFGFLQPTQNLGGELAKALGQLFD